MLIADLRLGARPSFPAMAYLPCTPPPITCQLEASRHRRGFNVERNIGVAYMGIHPIYLHTRLTPTSCLTVFTHLFINITRDHLELLYLPPAKPDTPSLC